MAPQLKNPNHPIISWARAQKPALNVADLGRRWGVTPQCVTQIVTRRRRPNYDLLLLIAKETSIPIPDLLLPTKKEERAERRKPRGARKVKR